jgi:hypothetical protein
VASLQVRSGLWRVIIRYNALQDFVTGMRRSGDAAAHGRLSERGGRLSLCAGDLTTSHETDLETTYPLLP